MKQLTLFDRPPPEHPFGSEPLEIDPLPGPESVVRAVPTGDRAPERSLARLTSRSVTSRALHAAHANEHRAETRERWAIAERGEEVIVAEAYL